MINSKENQAQLFSIFHDGILSFDRITTQPQCWKIDCQYLAQQLHPSCSFFELELHGVQKLAFHPWFKDIARPAEIWQEPSQIGSLELEISKAEATQEEIKIFVENSSSIEEIVGGELYLEAEGIRLFSPQKELLNIDSLKKIATDYWSKFGK